MASNIIPRQPSNWGSTAGLRLQQVTDGELMQTIGDADLRAACDEEDCAAGWTVDTVGDSIQRLAAEYTRRYGQSLPTRRSSTWHLYHTPRGYHWSADRQTLQDTEGPPCE